MRPTLVALALVFALASVMAVSASEAAVDVAGEVLVDAAAAVATSPIQVDAVLTDGMFVWWCVGGDVAASLRALVPRSLLRRTAYECGGDVTAGASSCVCVAQAERQGARCHRSHGALRPQSPR
jgi:hypothetical protein